MSYHDERLELLRYLSQMQPLTFAKVISGEDNSCPEIQRSVSSSDGIVRFFTQN